MFKSLLRQPARFGSLKKSARFKHSMATKSFTSKQRYLFYSAVSCSVIGATLYLSTGQIQCDTQTKELPVVSGKPKFTPEEVSEHNKKDDLWIVLNGKIYDLTNFLVAHPGGQKVLLKNAGKDGSKIFNPIHASDAIDKYLPAECYVGDLDGEFVVEEDELTDEEIERQDRIARKPDINACINIYDLENVARQILAPNALAYYCSASDDEVSLRENHNAYRRIFFNPKVLVDVSHCDISTEFFGEKVAAPFYVSATALAKLGNPEGEVAVAKGAGKEGIPQMISTMASCSFDEIMDAGQTVPGGMSQYYQLYVNYDRKLTERAIRHAEERGAKALFITVDAASLGRREKDMRTKFDGDADPGALIDDDEHKVDRSRGAAAALNSFIDPSLKWEDIDHFKTITKMPIILKGIQRMQDVFLAIEHGVDGVVLSNHGGRQLDYARAPVELLAEVMPLLKEQGLDKKIDIFVDGGVRRGTDIMKALCLGAKGVGLGRAFVWANSAYGEQGVQKACQLLKEEIFMNMRLLGVTKIEDLTPDLVDTRNLFSRPVSVPSDHLYSDNYMKMTSVEFKPSDEF